MSTVDFLTRCTKPERQQECLDPDQELLVFGGIIRQGVDCRAHVGTDMTGDYLRDENVVTPATPLIRIGTPRFWTKIGKKVRVRLELEADAIDGNSMFTVDTEPIYLFVGFLPFRRNPFDQPPPSMGGDVHGVLGTGSLAIYPNSQMQNMGLDSTNYTLIVTVMADYQTRTNPDPPMGTAGPSPGCYLIVTSPTGAPPIFPNGPYSMTGAVELEYYADSEDIQATGYTPTPGSDCPYTPEYYSLDTPIFNP